MTIISNWDFVYHLGMSLRERLGYTSEASNQPPPERDEKPRDEKLNTETAFQQIESLAYTATSMQMVTEKYLVKNGYREDTFDSGGAFKVKCGAFDAKTASDISSSMSNMFGKMSFRSSKLHLFDRHQLEGLGNNLVENMDKKHQLVEKISGRYPNTPEGNVQAARTILAAAYPENGAIMQHLISTANVRFFETPLGVGVCFSSKEEFSYFEHQLGGDMYKPAGALQAIARTKQGFPLRVTIYSGEFLPDGSVKVNKGLVNHEEQHDVDSFLQSNFSNTKVQYHKDAEKLGLTAEEEFYMGYSFELVTREIMAFSVGNRYSIEQTMQVLFDPEGHYYRDIMYGKPPQASEADYLKFIKSRAQAYEDLVNFYNRAFTAMSSTPRASSIRGRRMAATLLMNFPLTKWPAITRLARMSSFFREMAA